MFEMPEKKTSETQKGFKSSVSFVQTADCPP